MISDVTADCSLFAADVCAHMARGGARVRTAPLRARARARAGLAAVGARRARPRHQRLRAQGRLLPAPLQRLRLPQER